MIAETFPIIASTHLQAKFEEKGTIGNLYSRRALEKQKLSDANKFGKFSIFKMQKHAFN